jgi:hypothetical protein
LGAWSTVTCLDVVAEHLFASVTVTENEAVDEGLTFMPAVVSPVLHENEYDPTPPLPDAVSTVLKPEQIETVGGEIEAVTA